MYPIIFSLIVNLPAIMTYVVASVFFVGVITFVTVCTEVDATQERSHAGNHIVVVVMIVQVDLLIGCGFMVNDSVEMLSRYHMYLIFYQESLKHLALAVTMAMEQHMSSLFCICDATFIFQEPLRVHVITSLLSSTLRKADVCYIQLYSAGKQRIHVFV